MTQLRVALATIRNVLGCREAVIEPGRVTVLAGHNGSGKSSILTALQQGLGGGTSLARLATVPEPGDDEAPEPEVVLVLKGDGHEEYRVTRRADKVRVQGRVGDSAAFEDVPKPQQFLSGLFDVAGCNPVAFLTAKDDERALILLEALPLTLDQRALHDAMGLTESDLAELPPIPAGLHPLEHLAMLREAVFRRRTGVNRDASAKAKAADQTRRNAPAAVPLGAADAILRAEQEQARLSAEIAAGRARAEADHKAAVDAAQAEYRLATSRADADAEASIRALDAATDRLAAAIRAEAERKVAALKAEAADDANALRRDAEDRMAAAHDAFAKAQLAAATDKAAAEQALIAAGDDLASAGALMARLREQEANSVKAKALHDQAEQFDREAVELASQSAALTAALAALDAYRLSLTRDLPIPGLELDGKAVKVNGITFAQLNTAQRVAIAVKVALLRARGSRLPFVAVDGAEALDGEQFAALVEALKAEGVQAVLARVSDGPLRVEAVA